MQHDAFVPLASRRNAANSSLFNHLVGAMMADVRFSNRPNSVKRFRPSTAIWGPAHTEDTQYLRVYVGHLRQKIEEQPDDPRIIPTEPGIGYRISEGP
jgi:Transcriptional regulatory protein, C terminal